MSIDNVCRRDVLKALTMGAVVGSVLRILPLQAAEYAHALIATEKANTAAGGYAPKFFPAESYKTLQKLCDLILPADEHAGGALEAGAPEFIDLLTSENEEYQLKLGGGLLWLDSICIDRYGQAFLGCTPQQQEEILTLIAYRANAVKDPSLSQGVQFFSFLRNLTADGYFTSKVGIEYLGYIGNTFLPDFPGCPPVPGI